MAEARMMSPMIALVGNPNCGKTALFNRLTGARQKVANYAGVTIERKEGKFISTAGRHWRVLDLPGTYGLNAVTPDEKITQEIISGTKPGEALPDAIVCVVDATNLKRGLRLVLEIKAMGVPTILAINMMDVARKRKIHIDVNLLQERLHIPVVETVAVDQNGIASLLDTLEVLAQKLESPLATIATQAARPESPESLQDTVNDLLQRCVSFDSAMEHTSSYKLDQFVLHPVLGPAIFAVLMFMVFQAVFAWAQAPMDLIKSAVDSVANLLGNVLGQGMLQDLLVKGVISGAGSVLVFLPQIIILFFFILVMEDSGYLPRAAFLLTLYNGLGNGSESAVMRTADLQNEPLLLDGLLLKILRPPCCRPPTSSPSSAESSPPRSSSSPSSTPSSAPRSRTSAGPSS